MGEAEIKTVADFLKVPPKRLRACLKEFATACDLYHFTTKGLGLVQADILPGTPPLEWGMRNFVWIDDKAKQATVRIVVAPEAGGSDVG